MSYCCEKSALNEEQSLRPCWRRSEVAQKSSDEAASCLVRCESCLKLLLSTGKVLEIRWEALQSQALRRAGGAPAVAQAVQGRLFVMPVHSVLVLGKGLHESSSSSCVSCRWSLASRSRRLIRTCEGFVGIDSHASQPRKAGC